MHLEKCATLGKRATLGKMGHSLKTCATLGNMYHIWKNGSQFEELCHIRTPGKMGRFWKVCASLGKMGQKKIENKKNHIYIAHFYRINDASMFEKMCRTWENVPQWKQFATPKQLDHNLRNYVTFKNVPHFKKCVTPRKIFHR